MKLNNYVIIGITIIQSLSFLAGCYNGDDIIGKAMVQYDGEWSAVITENTIDANYSGNGDKVYIFENPDTLKLTAEKLDSSDGKLSVYVYEYERIVAGDSTRDPEGTASVEYEFPY